MDIKVLKHNGEDTGRKVALPSETFAIKPSDHAIYLDVKNILANRRQGTSKTKERGEVKGSSRKIKKQKGTGGARAGSLRNPIYRGGGRVFGPRPRDYSFKINKKVKTLARKSALTYKAANHAVTVIEDFDLQAPKTKQYLTLLNNLSVEGKKTLFILSENKKNVFLAGRNVQRTKVITDRQLNTYDIIHADQLIFAEKSIDKFNNEPAIQTTS